MDDTAARAPAPGRLALVQTFVNSVHLPDGVDELGDPRTAAGWLTHHGAQGVRVIDEASRLRLVDVREGLRTLLTSHTGAVVDQPAVDALMARLNDAQMRVVLRPGGIELTAASGGVSGFLATLLAGMVEASVAGTWDRLKICRDDECRWAFYDHSKNGRGAWCSMASCGCRSKSRAYRERRRATIHA